MDFAGEVVRLRRRQIPEEVTMGNKHLDSKEIKAYMGEDAVFKGVLTFSGTVRVDGRLEGEVQTEDTLIVGEKGVLEADISAGTVVCKGKITGSIKAI